MREGTLAPEVGGGRWVEVCGEEIDAGDIERVQQLAPSFLILRPAGRRWGPSADLGWIDGVRSITNLEINGERAPELPSETLARLTNLAILKPWTGIEQLTQASSL